MPPPCSRDSSPTCGSCQMCERLIKIEHKTSEARLRIPRLRATAIQLFSAVLANGRFRVVDNLSRMDEGSPVLELQFRDQLQEPKKCGVLIRS